MHEIGLALAGNTMIKDRGKAQMPAKYISPFSEMIKGIVNDCKNKELSAVEWDKAVIELAHRQLIIEECRKCRHPKAKDFCCSFCGDDNA